MKDEQFYQQKTKKTNGKIIKLYSVFFQTINFVKNKHIIR